MGVSILASSRRYQLLFSALSGGLLLFSLSLWSQATNSLSFPLLRGPFWLQQVHPDRDISLRVHAVQQQCRQADPFDAEYGRDNLRMSRGYEGSRQRLRDLTSKVLRGENITISAIGGSVTAGHHVGSEEIWFNRLGDWLEGFWPNGTQIMRVNGAAPASGSDYFSFCFPLHISMASDLVLVELAVNDEGILEHIEDMENLLRGLLDLPSRPAVILVEAMAFSNGGMGGGGGRMHLPVAQYYDVPVINQRHPLANHFARYPQLVPEYFAKDWWQNPDTRHINARGHRDLAMLIASLLRDVSCELVHSGNLENQLLRPNWDSSVAGIAALDQSSWPEQTQSWQELLSDNETKWNPGMFNSPPEQGLLPRLPVLEGWNSNLDHAAPPFHPTCLSTRAQDPQYELKPIRSDGWEFWTHPEHLDKPYLLARNPGATVSFQVHTDVGVIKMYSLRSKTFGLGNIRCWVDDQRDRAVDIVGWWEGDANIGRFSTIRHDVASGPHTVTCQVLEETKDPGGGHEFRIISLMSL